MEYRPFYLAREWVRAGHQVTIAAASYAHSRIRQPVVAGEVTEEHIEGIRYLWLKTPAYLGNGVRRVLNVVAFTAQLQRHSAALVGRDCPAAVIASSTHPFDMIPARRIASACGARLVFEVHDLWPLSLVELAGMSPRHPFIVVTQWAEDYAYRTADRVVSLLPKAEPHMRAHGLRPGRYVHIPNGIDVEDWFASSAPVPEQHRRALTSARQAGHFLLGYAGTHGTSDALDSLLEAAARLQDRPLAIVLVGQGPEKARLQQMAQQLRLTNVHFLPPVPKRVVPALLSQMDALYIGWYRQPLYRFGISPNKLVDYMMAARPIIHSVEAANDPAAAAGCSMSIPPEDPAAIAEAICRLMLMPQSAREAMGARGRAYVLAHHDYRVLARQFLAVLEPDACLAG